MSNRWAFHVLAGATWALVCAGGCSESDGRPKIVVTVESDIAPDADPHLVSVTLEVEGGKEPADATADLAETPLPRELTLVYGGGSRGPLTITAVGDLSNGEQLTQTKSGIFFEEDETVRLRLDEACIGTECPAGQTCAEGECQDVAVPTDGGAGDGGGGDGGGTTGGADGGPDGSPDGGDGAVGDGGDLCAEVDGMAPDCEVNTPCEVGVCDPMAGCVTEPLPDGSTCGTNDDGYCVAGVCQTAECGGGGECTATCRGTESCVYDCTNASRCAPACNGSSCIVDCTGAADCSGVECRKGWCLLQCAETTSCAFQQCMGQQQECGEGWTLCANDRSCP